MWSWEESSRIPEADLYTKESISAEKKRWILSLPSAEEAPSTLPRRSRRELSMTVISVITIREELWKKRFPSERSPRFPRQEARVLRIPLSPKKRECLRDLPQEKRSVRNSRS